MDHNEISEWQKKKVMLLSPKLFPADTVNNRWRGKKSYSLRCIPTTAITVSEIQVRVTNVTKEDLETTEGEHVDLLDEHWTSSWS